MTASPSIRPRRRSRTGKDPRRSARGRANLLREVAGKISGESFLPVEAAALFFGRLDTARRVAHTVWLREQVEKTGILALSYHPENEGLPPPPRPLASLSRLNRSRVYPPLLLPETTLPTVRVSEILEIIRHAQTEGTSWPRLLDLLAVSSGLKWSTAASLIETITGLRLAEKEITIVAQARQFWQHYAEGRARAVALQTAKEIPLWQGDWAHFDRKQFDVLLPGTILPDHCARHEYLANYVHRREQQSLDLYSVTGQALFQHPFPPCFQRLR